jgi:polyferredoxin
MRWRHLRRSEPWPFREILLIGVATSLFVLLTLWLVNSVLANLGSPESISRSISV